MIGRKGYGQAPSISYTTPQSLTLNVALSTAIAPTNSGGAVPAAVYGTVSTFAGSGAAGRTNATGTAASFSSPRGVDISATGNLYIADQVNNEIRRITPTGAVTLFAGSATGAAGSTNGNGSGALFNGPYGITEDGASLYVADYGNNQIRKINAAGDVTLFAGNSGGTSGTTNNATGTSALFNGPVEFAYSQSANAIYMSDFLNNQIRKISLTSPYAVTLFAGNAAGTAGSTNGTGNGASFNGPNGMAVDNSGNLYVADQNNNLIRKITPAGVVTTLAGNTTGGSADGTGTAASFLTPRGLTVDISNNVYINDSGNNTVRFITPAGVVTTIAGVAGTTGSANGVGTAASFNAARGLNFDPTSGNIFLADYGNNLIRKIITTGYSISPALPTGLIFNATNGQITGTPTALSPATDYTITAFNQNGSSATTLNLAVVNPPVFSYTNPQIYTSNVAISNLTPTNSGGTIISASTSPALPAGLSISTTGVISGTPTVVSIPTTYTVTASSSTGSSTANVNLTINPKAPVITYTTPQTFITNVAVSPVVSPSNTGGPVGTFGPATSILNVPSNNNTNSNGITVRTTTGEIYVTSENNKACYVYNSSGTLTFTQNTAAGISYTRPAGVIVDAAGTTYVADRGINGSTGTGKIFKTTTGGTKTQITGFDEPTALAFDPTGNFIYVVDRNSTIANGGKIYKIATTATSAGTAYISNLNAPWGVAVNTAGDMYISVPGAFPNNSVNSILKVPAGSTVPSTFVAANTSFNSPRNMVVDASGNIYEADAGSSSINIISPSGVVNRIATTGDSPPAIAMDASGNLYYSDYNFGGVKRILAGGYAITPTLPAGLSFSTSTGVISGTPTVVSAATNYTASGNNITGNSSTTINIAVLAASLTDANASANGITQGTLRPGQTSVVLFGFGITSGSANTYNSFTINTTYSSQNPSFYFTGYKLYKNTAANTFTGAVQVSGAQFSYNYLSSAIASLSITNISEVITTGSTPTYYFIVADINYNFNTLAQAAGTMQFSFATSQTNALTTSTTNISPNVNITGTTFTIAPPTLTSTDNNFTANGITSGSLSYGQTNIVLFSFKMVVDGVFTINQFDIPSNISVNPYFQNGQIYRSTTQYFSDAQPITATVAFNGTNTAVTGMTENFNSYTGSSTFYYFLLGNLTNTNAGTGPLNFSLSTATNAFTEANPYKQYASSGNITGVSFTVLTTYKWVGTNSADFNAANNYLTLNNNTITTAPNAASPAANIYIPNANTRLPILSASLTVGALTFDGNATPVLALNSKTLTLSNSLTTTANTVATINGGAVALTNAALTSNLGAGSILNMTGSAALTNAGIFTMASTSALNVTSGTVANSGTFILKSDASGSATIGPVPSATTFSGNYQVQRYVTGSSSAAPAYNTTRGNYTYRNYRIMSSPVSTGTNATFPVSSLTYVPLSAIVTGLTSCTGCTNTPTATGNPTLYLYREDFAGTSTSFTSSNFRPITAIGAPVLNVTGTPSTAYLYAGMGYLFYFRGDRINNTTAKIVSPYVAPENVVFSNTGTLNQGDIKLINWTNNSVTLTRSALSAVASYGLQLAGNPYASSIDWDNSAGYTTTGTISTSIYQFNPKTNQYDTYVRGTAGGNGTGGSNEGIITSGQAFFIRVTTAPATFTFKEAAKTTTQLTAATNLLLSSASTTESDKGGFMRIRLAIDSTNHDNVILSFKKGASEKYIEEEDGIDLGGSGAFESLSAYSKDDVALAVSTMPLPSTNAQIVPLSVNGNVTGIYQLQLNDIQGIPSLYDVWLMDKLKNDSLDLRAHSTYNFNLDRTNAATFGKNRFQIIIRKNQNKILRMLDFTANKILSGAKIAWTTENEFDYTKFVVERSIDNGKTFEVLGDVKSNNLGNYYFLDNSPIIGLNQYRLKEEDFDGTVTYSKIATLMYSNTSGNVINNMLSVYPNPTADIINVAINAPLTITPSYTIKITDGVGRVVKTATSTQLTWRDNIAGLKPGTYFVQLINNLTKEIVGNNKFIKL
ncbi:putative Ig domain-containing protein [Mucilaginibacter glaciei]|uniref:Ig domain-containing protein n=1 Tax=Mucilaginibacter glaciei TaxID=2772109 RepID=A0A926NQ89_9SPHI|nr:putative Ig domain-containing protein [Mucilaginibacter glaciei]MBD1393062.1 putative Ig domain-containing protein [Mucilaginibacter glaciei]